jgi:hypothetical protein
MKASELIQKLQEQIELHGDCKVWIGHYDMEFDCDDSYPASQVAFEDGFYVGNPCGENHNVPIIFVQ